MRTPIHALVEGPHKSALEAEAVRQGLSLSKFVYHLLFKATNGFTDFGGYNAGESTLVGHCDVEELPTQVGLGVSTTT